MPRVQIHPAVLQHLPTSLPQSTHRQHREPPYRPVPRLESLPSTRPRSQPQMNSGLRQKNCTPPSQTLSASPRLLGLLLSVLTALRLAASSPSLTAMLLENSSRWMRRRLSSRGGVLHSGLKGITVRKRSSSIRMMSIG